MIEINHATDYTTRDGFEVPLWFFENVDLPEIDFSILNWNDLKTTLLQSNQRKIANHSENTDAGIFEKLYTIRNDIIEQIKINHPIYGLVNLWPINTWKTNNSLNITIYKDSNNFYMHPHLDNRNIKSVFIMNLVDNPVSTEFDIAGKIIKAPTKKGSGSFYFNHSEIWHSIGPVSSDRYIFFVEELVS